MSTIDKVVVYHMEGRGGIYKEHLGPSPCVFFLFLKWGELSGSEVNVKSLSVLLGMCSESLQLNLKLVASASLDGLWALWGLEFRPTVSVVSGMCSHNWLFHGCWGIEHRSQKPLTHWDVVSLGSDVCLCTVSFCSLVLSLLTIVTKKDQRSGWRVHWILTQRGGFQLGTS